MTFERRDLEGGGAALVSTFMEEAGFLAAFTERTGGLSEGAFASLNLSYSSGDDPDRVTANRKRVIDSLGVGPFALGGQVHGSRLARVGRKRAGAGFDGPGGVLAGNDGLFTKSAGVPLAVATADCAPVVLCSPSEELIAVVHAGWRGLAAGILGNALALLGDAKGVAAAIGPAAGPCHYEVGEEVAVAVAAGSGAVTEHRGGRLFLDLPGTIHATLKDAGVGRIEAAGLCTIHEEGRFFSHRRDGRCGRQIGIGMRMGSR